MDEQGDNYKRWAEENPRHAWALENMSEGLFPNSVRQQVRIHGHLSDKQMGILWEKADQLERMNLGEIAPPKQGERVNTTMVITRAAEHDPRNDKPIVYRVTGTTKEGWTCRFELDPMDTRVEQIATRSDNTAAIKGTVAWVKDAFVILQSNSVQVFVG